MLLRIICSRFTTNSLSISNNPIHIVPLTFWRENQARFLAIAALARDVLLFPTIGVGVERLFNTTRDIYYYRRGRMKSHTIEDLMMFLYTSRFDIEEQEAKLLKKFFSYDEMEAARKRRMRSLTRLRSSQLVMLRNKRLQLMKR
ncbi:hypothetical protein N7474_008593 [Penicillium riverlandense]|uniref:uncharacterized protein n=1 Tax=Penicillium riverlandense TaxID=1903569 RepID=UPI0025484361|nr:uncharacterized protein N7474_008593 [Penicillium riverlandense]KAJ5812292.1 hypothetical protein N7474_008593 [Penicillium riverlandense]